MTMEHVGGEIPAFEEFQYTPGEKSETTGIVGVVAGRRAVHVIPLEIIFIFQEINRYALKGCFPEQAGFRTTSESQLDALPRAACGKASLGNGFIIGEDDADIMPHPLQLLRQ